MIEEKMVLITLKDKRRCLYVTRDITILEECENVLKVLQKEILETKQHFIDGQNEEEANKFLSLENRCSTITCGIHIFKQLKQNKPSEAWASLVAAQNHAHRSNAAYELSGTLQCEIIIHFDNIETVVIG